MSKRDKSLFLFDILIAVLKIKNTSNRFQNAQDLKYDYLSWDSVIREFEIIGEATNNLVKVGFYDDTKREIVDFRNILIHEYFGIDEDEVWGIIQNYLDELFVMVISDIKKIDVKHRKKMIDSLIEENRYLDFVVETLNEIR